MPIYSPRLRDALDFSSPTPSSSAAASLTMLDEHARRVDDDWPVGSSTGRQRYLLIGAREIFCRRFSALRGAYACILAPPLRTLSPFSALPPSVTCRRRTLLVSIILRFLHCAAMSRIDVTRPIERQNPALREESPMIDAGAEALHRIIFIGRRRLPPFSHVKYTPRLDRRRYRRATVTRRLLLRSPHTFCDGISVYTDGRPSNGFSPTGRQRSFRQRLSPPRRYADGENAAPYSGRVGRRHCSKKPRAFRQVRDGREAVCRRAQHDIIRYYVNHITAPMQLRYFRRLAVNSS